MRTHNAQNERVKRRYFGYLREAKRYSEASVDMVAKALHRFESHTRMRDFKAFHIEQAIAFKRHISEQVSAQTGERLSKATVLSTLNALKSFFHWLAGQPGFRSRLSYADSEYFNLSEKETRIAKALLEARVPTLDQVLFVIRNMPIGSEIELRNRALIALTLLTGARDRALASLKLKHINIAEGHVRQDAREVHTKFAKTFTTWFFPVGDEVRAIVEQWVDYLVIQKLWSLDDALFPATRVVLGRGQQFEAAGLDRRHWSDAGPIRKIFKEAFQRARLPYFNPHSFRKTLALLGQELCRTPEEFKAWSQNLGHEQVLTTFVSYGEVAASRQAAIIRALSHPNGGNLQLVDLAQQIMQVAQRTSAERSSAL